VNPEKLSAHLQVDRYGDFWLTEAVRPSLDLQVIPRQGFRVGVYRDAKAKLEVPVLVAAISREQLFDTFLDLLDPLGEVVDVVVETSHRADGGSHQDLHREQIDLPVFKSYCCDFEELLLNDGCTGVAVISNGGPMEVQFDEHKLLIVYARDLTPFRRILESADVGHDSKLKLITESEHFHSTDPQFIQQFEQLALRIGVGMEAEHVSW
jgi:hypothetical protein